jgi:hypothetical protein
MKKSPQAGQHPRSQKPMGGSGQPNPPQHRPIVRREAPPSNPRPFAGGNSGMPPLANPPQGRPAPSTRKSPSIEGFGPLGTGDSQKA